MAKVNLISCTPDPELTVAAIAKVCYDGEHSAEWWMNTDMWDNGWIDVDKMVQRLVASGHLSPLEHVSFTFEIYGVSRACTHQLVRHRVASYTQRSQRYTNASEAYMVVPVGAMVDGKNAEVMDKAYKDAKATYDYLINHGVKKEDARYVLPEGTSSHIVVTMNARELLHFFECRCCQRAQYEIRNIADQMLALVKQAAPAIFRNAGAPCTHGECKEGKNSCGKQADDIDF